MGCAAGAAGGDAEDGAERDVRVQPAAVPAAAPAPLPRRAHRPALQLLLRQRPRGRSHFFKKSHARRVVRATTRLLFNNYSVDLCTLSFYSVGRYFFA